jgi:hypothetical protein
MILAFMTAATATAAMTATATMSAAITQKIIVFSTLNISIKPT